ncbi:AAA family ATPase [Pseudenhygromyxa sp. WMMC2535]|uniref:protein kinase domain-containing protein n=1 Tax=Pseudenhygromyxa sp. WMMC2535 TaxID=2712867 RepID=UPI0015955B7F|nr:AAA family ATPase [Pseudenhygromyxa sp. WMMC2535]NVB42144.1 AAA family ATPase [Pseudenhygromyxa sp. WMMC2535]
MDARPPAMALPLTGHGDFRLLRATSHARVYEGVREEDKRAVVVKLFELEDEDVEARVEHELSVLESLDVEGVVRALELRRVGDQLALVLERAPGINLAHFTQGRPLELERFADIATKITEILVRVHARRVIHRDIKPTNILIDPQTGAVHLADFGISVLLERERRYVHDPEIIAGTLPYISPEQTGRTTHPVDFRSDLYSLGVTFYELLSGRPPFGQREPLELIHAHLARPPVPISRRCPELPDGYARVIAKLLAKAPEHRYQSAEGLAADLRELGERLARGDDGASMVLGLDDFSHTLTLPHRLYEREPERERLREVFAAVVEQQAPSTVLITGPAGIGKSALLDEFRLESAELGCYVATGRFEDAHARPYAGLVDAFASLVDQLLTESEARLTNWRTRLRAALGGVAGVLVEFVPALEAVIGEPPPLPHLEPRAARNRVHLAVSRFLSVFCERERPLVIALDDLHLADESSVELLDSVLIGNAQEPLMVVASARVSEDADLPAKLGGLSAGAPTRVELEPLSPSALEALLVDALGRPASELAPLLHLVTRKTDNNPRFVRQLLEHLATCGLLVPDRRGWTWDEDALSRTPLPDDILEVLELELARLSPPLAEIFERAACIGERFDLATLEQICEQPRASLVAALYELVDLGLLDRVGDEHRFAHQGVREAARAKAGASLAGELRWQIGQRMLEGGAPAASTALFELADHLDAGLDHARALTLDDDQRVELAQLYARAGALALASGAHDIALRYLERGLELTARWRQRVVADGQSAPHYALVVDLHETLCAVLTLSKRQDRSDEVFQDLLAWSLRDLDRGRITATWVTQLQLTGRAEQALDFGLAQLSRWGCKLGRSPNGLRVKLAVRRARVRMRELDRDSLLALPECTNERSNALMDIFDATRAAAYVLDHRLFLLLISTHICRFLRDGVHHAAPLVIAQFGISLGGGMGLVDEANRLAELAIALSERFPNTSAPARTASAVTSFIAPLGQPFAALSERLSTLYPRNLERGDLLWAGYAGPLNLSMQLEIGTHLASLRKLYTAFERDLSGRGASDALIIAGSIDGMATVLSSTRDQHGSETSGAWAALDPVLAAERGASRYTRTVSAANLALTRLVLGDYEDALELALSVASDMESVLFASWHLPRLALTLLLASSFSARCGGPSIPAALERDARRVVAHWARGSSDNYGHYQALAEALRAYTAGEAQASALAEEARARAAKRGCRWVQGLASELLIYIAERQGLPGFAEGARIQAWDAYEAWGARAKLERLRVVEEGPDDRPRRVPTTTSLSGSWSLTGSSATSYAHLIRPQGGAADSSSNPLDFDSVLRSVASIASDLRLDEVIANMLEATLTNAGADHGVLVLQRDEAFGIVAEAELDQPPRVLSDPLPLHEAEDRAPTSLIHFVLRTEQPLVVDDAGKDARFADDPYIIDEGLLSLLGMPIALGKQTLGVLVLENRQSRGVFTSERFESLQLIAGQAARALDRARIHGALRESEARWRTLVDGAPDLIALIDSRGEAEFVNRNSRADGPNHAALLERFAAPAAKTGWREALDAVLRTGALREIEIELPADGPDPTRWYVARFAPIELSDEGEHAEAPRSARKAIVIATDISARKLAEADTKRLEAQLRQQQRLESIGTLASGVAHEINNPIQGIMNYAELIGGNPEDRPLVVDFAAEIGLECERVATIVRNLLAFSRQERQQPIEEVRPHALVEATLSLLRAVMRRDQIELRVQVPDALPPVRCRVQQIQQIIMNLVTNARDAIKAAELPRPRRVVEIRAEQITSDGQAWLRMIVEDWGPGIPPDVLPNIFDPFFTTKGRDQGTGLGLSVSHGIAQEHGGVLEVDSAPGEGTRFILDLPLPRSGDALDPWA